MRIPVRLPSLVEGGVGALVAAAEVGPFSRVGGIHLGGPTQVRPLSRGGSPEDAPAKADDPNRPVRLEACAWVEGRRRGPGSGPARGPPPAPRPGGKPAPHRGVWGGGSGERNPPGRAVGG